MLTYRRLRLRREGENVMYSSDIMEIEPCRQVLRFGARLQDDCITDQPEGRASRPLYRKEPLGYAKHCVREDYSALYAHGLTG